MRLERELKVPRAGCAAKLKTELSSVPRRLLNEELIIGGHSDWEGKTSFTAAGQRQIFTALSPFPLVANLH